MGRLQKAVEKRANALFGSSPANPERWFEDMFGVKSKSGVNVTEMTAMQSTAVFASIRVLTETVGSLPIHLYRRLEVGKERAIDHPIYRLLNSQPNPEMTQTTFKETMTGHIAGWGNGYAEIETGKNGYPVALWPLRPDRMYVFRRNYMGDVGDRYLGPLIYRYFTSSGTMIDFPPDRILHIPGFGYNGVLGYSPISMAREAVGLHLAAEQFGAEFFKNDARPGMVLQHPGRLGEKGRENLRASWEEKHMGLDNAQRMAILEEGVTIKEIGIPPVDAQFLETRKFQTEDIARIFRVPLHLIQDLDHATFSNIEHQSIDFMVYTMRPYFTRWEEALYLKLLSSKDQVTYFPEFLIDALLRGDMKSRYEAYQIGRNGGWLTANMILEMENKNPLPGDEGNIALVPLNMMNAADIASTPKPASTNRAIELRAQGKINRQRLRKAYHPLFSDVAQRIVKREVTDLRAGVKKYLLRGNVKEFNDWLGTYYNDLSFKDYVTKTVKSVMTTYGGEIHTVASQRIGADAKPDEVASFIGSYADMYVSRHVGRSMKAIQRCLEKRSNRASVDDMAALGDDLNSEFDSWDENRADSIATNETVREDNAVSKETWMLGGITALVWSANANCCPICAEMDGNIVGIEVNFLDAGEALDVPGIDTPFESSSDAGHPPIHDGCECSVEPQ